MNDDEILMNNFQDETTDSSCSLSKNEVIKLLYNQDSDIELIAPEKFKSPIWERFRIVFYKGARLNYVQCIGCSLVLVYKSRTGTASLLRHRCSRFPISVYDLKLENNRAILVAAGQLNLLSEMASSQNNESIELKQEMLTDEEEIDEQDDDQKYSSEQTDKGLLESFSLLEKTFITGDDLLLSREEIEHAKRSNDPDLFFERPRNHRHSSTWDRFEIVYYRNVRQNFAKCFTCNSIVSYKKTTGTASLIRHKCKSVNLQQANSKNDSLASLLVASSGVVAPPPLTPAPIFSPKQSTSSASVSSTSTTSVLKLENQKLVPVLVQGSRTDNVVNAAEKNLINSQIEWLSQCLISTEILGDSSYLGFLQNLINYGADYGKQNVTTFINRETISRDIIPKKCVTLQNDLMSELKDIEFSVSFSTWTNLSDDRYVTVFGYYFNQNFAYKNAILGTRKINGDNEVVKIVKDIVRPYTNFGDQNLLKCVSDDDLQDFDVYPCVISRITKVIVVTMNSSDESKSFFKKIYIEAHEVMGSSKKYTFESSCNSYKLKTFYSLYQFLKNDEIQGNGLLKKFMNLLSILFAAITSLVETNEDGTYCATANRVYLWYKKFLKHYSDFTSTDKIVNSIGTSIFKLIKENFNTNIRELYQIAVFLNPNFKSLKFLTPAERNTLLDIVKKNLEKLMNDDSSGQPSSKKQKVMKNQAHLNDTFLEFMDITMESVDDQVDSEIQRYMGYKLDNPIDILEFWAANDSFPYLKRLAKNYLNLPSCTFHNNCCFLSDTSFYQKCKYLPTEDVESLTFLHQNIKI